MNVRIIELSCSIKNINTIKDQIFIQYLQYHNSKSTQQNYFRSISGFQDLVQKCISMKFILFRNQLREQFKILQKQMQKTYQPSSAHPLNIQQESSSVVIRRQNKKTTLIGCQKGDFQKTLENVRKLSNRYDGDQSVSINPDVQYFKKYGTGIYLFFHFAKRLAILFTILGLISLAPVIFNLMTGDAYGGMISSFGVYIAQTTVGNLSNNPTGQTNLDESTSNNYKMANAIPNLAISLLVLAFYVYWEVKSDKLSEEIKEKVRFQCHYTIQVVGFPGTATEKDIEDFFSQFGKIKEVAPVQNFSELIDMAKDIYELQNQSKTKSLKLQLLDNQYEKGKYTAQIIQSNSKISHLQKQFLKIYRKSELSVIKFFVVFEELESRQKALKAMRNNKKCCSWGNSQISEDLLLNGQPLIIEACHNQPANILWQNQHIPLSSTIFRVLVQGILLILAITATFLVISLINIVTPSTSTNMNVSAYNASSILSVTNSTILYVWCIDNQDFMTTLPSIDQLCEPYITKYYVNLVIGILISFVVVGVKIFLKKIVISLAKFQKYKEQTEQSLCITRNLFLTYLSTTVLITLLLQAQLFGFSFKQLIGNMIKSDYLAENLSLLQEYKDFVPFWYVDIGYKITLTWIILAFQAPLVEPLLCLISEKLRFWQASKQLTQNSMEKKLTPPPFQIEDHYANILLLLFVGLAFSPGMPIILLPCAAGFVLRYFYFKIMFIRFSKVPQAYDEALNESIINYFPILLFFHFVFAIWMFSASSIFTKNESFFSSLINSSSEATQKLGQILRRFGGTWYYSIAFILFLAIVMVKIFFYDLLYQNIKNGQIDQIPTTVMNKIKSSEEKGKETGNTNFTATAEGQQRTLTNSYQIENNPNYYQILAIFNRLKLSI